MDLITLSIQPSKRVRRESYQGYFGEYDKKRPLFRKIYKGKFSLRIRPQIYKTPVDIKGRTHYHPSALVNVDAYLDKNRNAK